MTLSGTSSGTTTTAADGTYKFNVPIGGNYTVTPSHAALPPTSPGINTLDVIAVQRYYLTLGTLACPQCADVTGNGRVDTSDVVAIQRFFLGQTFGTGNTGQYRFTPTSRSYTAIASDKPNQDYSTCVMGDVVGPFVHRPAGGPGADAAGEGELPATVAAVSLPNGAVDSSVTNFTAQVTTTAIDPANRLVGFQGDFTFDERVVTFQDEPVQSAGLTAVNWNVSGNVLPVLAGAGPMRTLRISAYSTDLTPLSGSGTLFELRMIRASKAAQGTQLIWVAPPNQFIFIDADLKTQRPGYTASGGVNSSGEAPAPPKAAPTRTVPPLDVTDPNGTEGDEATLAEGNGVLFALFQRTTPREPWQRIRLE
jgi:hypothetical protein